MDILRSTIGAIGAALLIAAAPAAAGAPAAPQSEDSAARRAKALEIAQIVEPREGVVDPARLEAEFVAAMLATEDMQALEAEYPGLVQAVWRAVAPEVLKYNLARLPSHWERLADIYSSHLTLQQLTEAAAFLGSPTGRKVVALAQQGGVGPAVAAGAKGEAVSAADYLDMQLAAVKELSQGLSKEEQEQVAAFDQSSAGLALLSVGPLLQQVTLEWINTSDPEADARMEAAIMETMESYIAAADASKKGEGKGKRKG